MQNKTQNRRSLIAARWAARALATAASVSSGVSLFPPPPRAPIGKGSYTTSPAERAYLAALVPAKTAIVASVAPDSDARIKAHPDPPE